MECWILPYLKSCLKNLGIFLQRTVLSLNPMTSRWLGGKCKVNLGNELAWEALATTEFCGFWNPWSPSSDKWMNGEQGVQKSPASKRGPRLALSRHHSARHGEGPVPLCPPIPSISLFLPETKNYMGREDVIFFSNGCKSIILPRKQVRIHIAHFWPVCLLKLKSCPFDGQIGGFAPIFMFLARLLLD